VAKMFLVTAKSGDYADRCNYNLFVCPTEEAAETCLRAIQNWFELQGVEKALLRDIYRPEKRDAIATAFILQFNVHITIDYTGVEFEVEPIEVFDGHTT